MPAKLLLTLFSGVSFAALDIAILGPLLPTFREIHHLTLADSSWIVTIYVLAHLVGTTLLGSLADHWGSRNSFSVGLVLMMAGTALVALEPSFAWLLAARALQGFGSGGLFPIATSIIGTQVAPQKQGRYLGLSGATFGIAFLIGPPLAALFHLRAHWTGLFWIQLPFLAASLLGAWTVFPRDGRRDRGGVDLVGLGLFSGGLVALALGFSWISPKGEAPRPAVFPIALALGLGLVCLVLFLRWIRSTAHPLLSPALLENQVLRRVFVLALGAGLGEMGVTLLPDLAVQSMGLSKAQASLLLLPFVIGILFGAMGSGRLLEKTGAKPLLIAGLGAQALALASFGVLPTSKALFWVAGTLFGAGLSCLLAGPLRWVVLRHTPASSLTMAQAQLSVSILVGQIASAPLMGALAAFRVGDLHLHFAAAGLASLALLWLAFGLPHQTRSLGEAAS